MSEAEIRAKLEALKAERDKLVAQANFTAGLVAAYEQILAAWVPPVAS